MAYSYSINSIMYQFHDVHVLMHDECFVWMKVSVVEGQTINHEDWIISTLDYTQHDIDENDEVHLLDII